jgi:mono/diheme cytochrome c family protein
MKSLILGLVLTGAGLGQAVLAAGELDQLLKSYQSEGAASFNAKQGELLWHKDFPDPERAGQVRNCSTCHGSDLKGPGKHVKTGKVIEPMAPSVNSERLTDPKFMEKWFKRNCKWVMGRECTPQEKGDVLTYLKDK